jgi:hypothetical protein
MFWRAATAAARDEQTSIAEAMQIPVNDLVRRLLAMLHATEYLGFALPASNV